MAGHRSLQFKTKLPTTCALVELTPLVDVIFLMLVFFILTADVLPLKSMNVASPPLDKTTSPLLSPLLLTVDAQYHIFVGPDKECVNLDALGPSLERRIGEIHREKPGRVPVIVLSLDQGIDYGYFLGIFSIAQQYASKVRLAYRESRGVT